MTIKFGGVPPLKRKKRRDRIRDASFWSFSNASGWPGRGRVWANKIISRASHDCCDIRRDNVPVIVDANEAENRPSLGKSSRCDERFQPI